MHTFTSRLLLTLVFAVTLLPAFAQKRSASGTTFPNTNKEEVYKKNIAKINLSSLALKNFSLSYERSLARKITFVAGYSHLPETKASSVFLAEKAVERYMGESKFIDSKLDNATMANNSFTGEVRFYAGKHAGARGLYLSVYGRYMNLTGAYPYDYDLHDKTYHLPFQGTVKGVGGGLMVGAQWLIANRVTLDWYILGGHYGQSKADVLALADLRTMTPEEKKSLQKDMEDAMADFNDLVGTATAVETTVTDKQASMKGNMPFVGIRGAGINVGIAF